jgi:hypothetical protein
MRNTCRKAAVCSPDMARFVLDLSPMRIFSCLALFACLTSGSLLFGQDPAQGTQAPQKPTDAPKVSVTGCLMKGNTATEFVITESKSGTKVPFAGPAQLEKYVNQTVTLTGTMASQGQDKVFKPESISQVAATCEKAQ